LRSFKDTKKVIPFQDIAFTFYGLLVYNSIKNTINPLAPWAPNTNDCAISAVLVFTEKDTNYMVYHAYTRSADGKSLLNIKPLYITKDRWPSIEATDELFKMDAFEKKVLRGK